MLRLFGWMVAGGVLLGSAAIATAQDPPPAANPAPAVAVPGAGYGYQGVNPYGDALPRGIGNPAYPGPTAGSVYGWGGPGCVVPVIGGCKECFTPYPLSTTYPYSYTGPGSAFGAYAQVPYPYAPIGYGWYGEHWRGW